MHHHHYHHSGALVWLFIFFPIGIGYLLGQVHPALAITYYGLLLGGSITAIVVACYLDSLTPPPVPESVDGPNVRSANTLDNSPALGKIFSSVGLFISLGSSLLELAITGKTLFKGTDRRQLVNKNATRTADFAHSIFKVVGISVGIALFFAFPAAAPIAVSIVVLGSALYYFGRGTLALINAFKASTPEKRAAYQKEALTYLGYGLMSVAAMALIVTMMVVPMAPAVMLGIGIAATVIGGLVLVGNLIKIALASQLALKNQKSDLLPKIQSQKMDAEIILEAQNRQKQSKSWYDYRHTVDHAHVVSQLGQASQAHQYLRQEIERQQDILTQSLQSSRSNRAEEPKRRAKQRMLNRFSNFLDALEDQSFNVNPTENFEDALVRFFKDQGNNALSEYQQDRKLAFQSFGLECGKVEAVYRGLEQHHAQLQENSYTTVMNREQVLVL